MRLRPFNLLAWTFVIAASGAFYYGVYVVVSRLVAGL